MSRRASEPGGTVSRILTQPKQALGINKPTQKIAVFLDESCTRILGPLVLPGPSLNYPMKSLKECMER
jgi:hypothetical protein